jgi:phage shock protein A
VAREAAVSTWFVYNQSQVHRAVQEGIATQQEHGRRNSPAPGAQQVSPAGLRTDLALAREEIKDLKKERDRLRNRVRLSLGTELDQVSRSELIARAQQLEQQNTTLDQQLSEAKDRITVLEGQLRETEDDLTAARAGLRRAMRAVPSP